jgi:hypothetical protein
LPATWSGVPSVITAWSEGDGCESRRRGGLPRVRASPRV